MGRRPVDWLARHAQLTATVAKAHKAYIKAEQLPTGRRGRGLQMVHAKSAHDNALAANAELPFHDRKALMKTFSRHSELVCKPVIPTDD